MNISKIEVKNFRLLKNFRLELEDNLSIILGKNNTGKTSILSVLNKFIGDKTPFSYNDFSIEFRNSLFSAISDKKEWVPEYSNGIVLNLIINYSEADDLSILSRFMMDLSPTNNKIVLGFEYTLNQTKLQVLRHEYEQYKKEHPELAQNCKNCFEAFMKSKHQKYFDLIIKSFDYDYKECKPLTTSYSLIDKNDNSLKELISFKYISARRLVTNKENDGTLSHLSSKYYDGNESSELHKSAIYDFENTLIKTDQELDKVYKSLFGSVLEKVKKFGGIKENETDIKIISSLQQRNLIKSNTTVVYNDDNHMLPESYNGLGYLNLLNIIFELETILSTLRKDGKEDAKPSSINIIFIEEPEAHTHPQMQYIFIKNIKDILLSGSNGSEEKNKLNLQTLITTHSSHIVSESNFNDLKYLLKNESKNIVAKNLKSLEVSYKKETEEGRKRYKFLKQYLTLNRAEIFFADKVVLVEGDTERLLIPAMMKKIDTNYPEGIPLLSQNISIIEVGNYSHIFDEFIKFLEIKTLIITDIDSSTLTRTVDKEGNPKQEFKKNKVALSNVTTNASLKHFHSEALETLSTSNPERENYELNYFVNLSNNDKSLKVLKNKWHPDKKGKLRLVYQVNESDSNSCIYCARSFEDAFFHINRSFIISNLSSFRGLKKIEMFDMLNDKKSDEFKYDSYDLAENCVDGKPSFAMDILLNSVFSNGDEFSNWDIPLYIKEGLLWIKQN